MIWTPPGGFPIFETPSATGSQSSETRAAGSKSSEPRPRFRWFWPRQCQGQNHRKLWPPPSLLSGTTCCWPQPPHRLENFPAAPKIKHPKIKRPKIKHPKIKSMVSPGKLSDCKPESLETQVCVRLGSCCWIALPHAGVLHVSINYYPDCTNLTFTFIKYLLLFSLEWEMERGRSYFSVENNIKDKKLLSWNRIESVTWNNTCSRIEKNRIESNAPLTISKKNMLSKCLLLFSL